MEQTIQDRKHVLLGFTLRDVAFAAIIAAAIQVVGFITIPLVGHIPVPGIRGMVSAPFSALLLTLATARIRKWPSIGLVYGFNCVVYAFVSPVIPAFVLSGMIIIELFNWLIFRGYSSRTARLICVPGFYAVMTPLGTLWGAWILGGQYQRFIASLPMVGLATAIVAVLALAGTLVGERIVVQLQRAGKMA